MRQWKILTSIFGRNNDKTRTLALSQFLIHFGFTLDSGLPKFNALKEVGSDQIINELSTAGSFSDGIAHGKIGSQLAIDPKAATSIYSTALPQTNRAQAVTMPLHSTTCVYKMI